METRTDNEIIAEFMGAKFINDAPDEFPHGYYYWPEGDWNSIEELIYNESWDWLMPVVEKIATLNAEVKFSPTPNRCLISYFEDETDEHQTGRIYTHKDHKNVEGESLIAVTYSAVVRFIKWYNASNQPQKAS